MQGNGDTFSAAHNLTMGNTSVAGDETHGDKVLGDKIARDKVFIEKLVQENNYYNQPLPTAAMGSAVPASAIDHFVDRGEIMDRVRSALKRGDTAAIVGVRGMGGVGKTELARFLALEYEKQFGKVVLWVNVNARGLEIVHGEMAKALGIQFGANDDAEARHSALRAALSHSTFKLVVLDDVRQSFAHNLRYCLPPDSIAALLTSRRRELPGVRENNMIPLDVMNETQALELLHSEGPRPALAREPAAAKLLAKRFGYHPLSLILAAKRLHKRLLDSETPVAAFNASEEHALNLVSAGEHADDSVRASILLSYAELNEADQARFNRLAVFAAGGFSLTAAAAVWGESEKDARNALERMEDISLVKPVENVTGRFQLHDLLKEFAEEKLAEDSVQSEAAEHAHALFLIALFARFYTGDMSTAPAVGWEKENLIEAAGWAMEQDEGNLLALLAITPRNWLYNIYRINDEWMRWLNAVNKIGVTKPELEAYTRIAIGEVHYMRDENDAALASYHTALNLFQRLGDRLGEANTRKAIGDVQKIRDDYDVALANYQIALTLFQQLGSHLGEANTGKAIGDLQKIRGDYDAALTSYQNALGLFQQVSNRLGEAYTHISIGDVERFQDKNNAAVASYQTALLLFQQVGDHLGEANTYGAMSRLEIERDQMTNAIKYLEQAVTLHEEIGSQYDVAADYGNFALVLYYVGNKTLARLYAARVEPFFRSINHPASDKMLQIMQEE